MSNWISVDDMFKPESGKHILIFVGGNYELMIQGFYDIKEDDFYDWDGDWLEYASYWCDLPENPESEE